VGGPKGNNGRAKTSMRPGSSQLRKVPSPEKFLIEATTHGSGRALEQPAAKGQGTPGEGEQPNGWREKKLSKQRNGKELPKQRGVVLTERQKIVKNHFGKKGERGKSSPR